ncbi:polyprenyl synthetase family protein [bacterium]|nr:polyprenyl synthetase family protein [bacterium]
MLKIDFEKSLQKIEDRIKYFISMIQNEVAQKEILRVVFAGGKRVRPYLTLIGAQYGKRWSDSIISVGALIELLHTASLIHDDVIDSATERRGEPTISSIYGDNVAILIGDNLIALILKEISKIENKRFHKKLSNAFYEMVNGEISQYNSRFKNDTSLKSYRDKIIKKTALLLEVSLFSGAILSGASPKTLKELSNIGISLGISFQIRDDILDFIDFDDGKTKGIDILSGQITLPIIMALKNNNINYTNPYFDEKIALYWKTLVTDKELNFCFRRVLHYLIRVEKSLNKIGVSKEFLTIIRKLKIDIFN